MTSSPLVKWFNEITMADLPQVGGKNASLGEMICHLSAVGVQVPGGFATTATAYREFMIENQLDKEVDRLLTGLDVNQLGALKQVGESLRQQILSASFPLHFVTALKEAYQTLGQQIGANPSVAVRSSATAEDLPQASFAGQQETYLNVQGIENVLIAIKKVFASLFMDRAIAYRVHQGFAHQDVALSVGIQQMVRSDIGSSGVMFTMDTESGFDKVIFITAAYGLGETVVQGAVNPDEFYVYKAGVEAGKPAILRRQLGSKQIKMIYGEHPDETVKTVPVPPDVQRFFSITDKDAEQLARYALLIEKHYGRPMDIEWGKDGKTNTLYILQARPETVMSQALTIQRYTLSERGKVLVQGRAIGQRMAHGKVRLVRSVKDMNTVEAGEVLVTDMTDPDWEPVMKRASAIVTNRGGRTCHAAIIAREMGIPAVVGCGDATNTLKTGDMVTVSCAEGDTGLVYDGHIAYQVNTVDVQRMPEIPFKIMMNVGDPDRAFDFQKLPNGGVGLARLEFIISRMIGIHPKALIHFQDLSADLKAEIQARISGYASPVEFYVQKLIEGISTIAAAFYPKPVIVRLSDFKSNEYAHLLGGAQYEPNEENPMLGFRGASRYISPDFRECFELECRAVQYVRDQMGLTNVEPMIPFVRTPLEAKAVVELLEALGLKRGKNGLRLIMMCEIPSNALLAEDFLEYFDGFSIGSNDLTQLTLGLDRDSGIVAAGFDERNPAVKALLHRAISVCKRQGKYIGICGQGPSDYPDFAEWLVEEGIESISLNPDSVIDTWIYLAEKQKNRVAV